MRAVFLDRDGVLNSSLVRDGRPYAPTDIAEFQILPGVPHAVRSLHEAGFLTIVVTNQPDLAEGKVSRQIVDAINSQLDAAMPLTAIMMCDHAKDAGCDCRKPRTGMLLKAAKEYGIDLRASVLVGDRWRDIDAAHAAGCTSYFIDYGYDEPISREPDFTVANLAQAAEHILKTTNLNG